MARASGSVRQLALDCVARRQKRIFIFTSSREEDEDEGEKCHNQVQASWCTKKHYERRQDSQLESFSRSSSVNCRHSSAQQSHKRARNGPKAVPSEGGRRDSFRQMKALVPLASLLVVLLVASLSVALAAGQQQLQPMPTVIVRGFLNYRTTVDGTVLLFTPDAGGQQASATLAAAAAIQPTPSAAPVQPTSSTAATFYNNDNEPAPPLVPARQRPFSNLVEPTSVLANSPPTATASSVPVASADGEPAGDEWRPIQATPPLKSQAATPLGSAPPSVQADDLEAPSQQQPTSSTTTTTQRPKRPSLGFSAAAANHRARPSPDGSTSSINGIRRPGLTTPAPTTAGNSIELSSANAANAFQSRLANANTRMRNRQRHKHPFASQPAVPKPNPSETGPTQLDVASSIETPTRHHEEEAGHQSAGLVAEQTAAASAASLPVVGSDEITLTSGAEVASSQPEAATIANGGHSSPVESEIALEPINAEQAAGLSALSRAGELRPSSMAHRQRGGGSEPDESQHQARPKLLSGGLQQGALSSGSMSFDALFQSDQPQPASGDQPPHQQQQQQGLTRPNGSALSRAKAGANRHSAVNQHNPNNNEKLSGWLGQHHNKFVPRPANAGKPAHGTSNDLSHQLAANLNQLAPPAPPNPVPLILPTATMQASVAQPPQVNQTALTSIAALDSKQLSALESTSANVSTTTNTTAEPTQEDQEIQSSSPSVSMQTITKTYSTIIETSKTRLVPLQVKSSTAVFTITEDYVMTKLMTAYQTMPAGEFLLPELSTRSPFDVFGNLEQSDSKTPASDSNLAPPAVAAPAIVASGAPAETQEQPISLDSSPKSANNWLHDFTQAANGQEGQQLQQQQQLLGLMSNQNGAAADPLQALLEQQAREANLAGVNFPAADLEQLASQLDPAALLADGTIQIPDLNNPLVLAAAIQNPQLAAVILAAQQLRLKQRNGLANLNNQQAGLKPNQQQQQQVVQLQPSYSTSFSTVVRPSTYTSRDTMYTTRLVSFRDGRTVRTRTVSEPGSVVEQVLTTTLTETIPITMTIRPTGVLSLPSLGAATAAPGGGGGPNLAAASSLSNQATINNALFATQLANILARRQQQLQTSFNNPALLGAGNLQAAVAGGAATPQQLLALQQLFNQQKRQQPAATSQTSANQQQQQQFQPNLQQLLQSMGNQQPAAATSGNQTLGAAGSQPIEANNQQQQQGASQAAANQQQQQAQMPQQTPPLPQVPKISMLLPGGPITTTLTSLQVRTYTVHNAFKTIFRTITSTVLIPTVLPSG